MNILEVCSILQLLKKETISFADIGSIIGISRQYVSKMKNDELDDDKLIKIEKYYNVNLPRSFEIVEKSKEENGTTLKGKSFNIPYWQSGNEKIDQKLRDEELTEFGLDLEFIVRKLKCNPEDLRIICMPGDDMNGGEYPLRNKDILLIDTARTDTFESGVYFATSHNHSRIYVRRIFEKMAKDKSYYTSVDNERYKAIIDKVWTTQQWKEADIKVIGRVIKNMSYTI